MSTIRDSASDRDRMMWRHFATEADDLCDKLENWIQWEIKALIPHLQTIIATSSSRQIRSIAQTQITLLREIHAHRVPDIVNVCKARIEDVRQGHYGEPFDACDYLRDGTMLLEATARDLCRLRAEIDDMMEPSGDVPVEPGRNTPDDDPT